MILGPSAGTPILVAATGLMQNYMEVFKSDESPYKETRTIQKVAGYTIECVIYCISSFLPFSINLVGRVGFIQRAHPVIQIIAEICQPLLQAYAAIYITVLLRGIFRKYFIPLKL